MARKTAQTTRTSRLLLRQTRFPMPLRCPCGALLMKLTGPARLEIKCRRCPRLLSLEVE